MSADPHETQQAGTMFRLVGIVVVNHGSKPDYFAALAFLAAGLALADLAGLAAFLAVDFGAAFFVAISLAPFREGLWVPF